MHTSVIWRFCSCCCQLRIVSNRQTQMLIFPTRTDFPTPLIRMQRVELRSWRRSLIRRGFWWSSRTGTNKNKNNPLIQTTPAVKNDLLSQPQGPLTDNTDIQSVIYTHNRILLSLKQEGNSHMCYDVDETWRPYDKNQPQMIKYCVILLIRGP